MILPITNEYEYTNSEMKNIIRILVSIRNS
jgi:hypothetical protein